MRFCNSCGGEISKSSKFCKQCGEKVDHLSSNKTAFGWIETLPEKYRKKLIPLGVGLIIILLLIAVIPGKNSSAEVAEQFIEFSIDREWEKGRELWSEAGINYLLSQLGDEGWIEQSMMNLSHRYPLDEPATILKSYKVINEDIDGKESEIMFDLVFDNGRQERALFQMIKEDGDWKVYAFSSGR